MTTHYHGMQINTTNHYGKQDGSSFKQENQYNHLIQQSHYWVWLEGTESSMSKMHASLSLFERYPQDSGKGISVSVHQS